MTSQHSCQLTEMFPSLHRMNSSPKYWLGLLSSDIFKDIVDIEVILELSWDISYIDLLEVFVIPT